MKRKLMHGGEGFLWVFGLLCLFSYLFSILEKVTK